MLPISSSLGTTFGTAKYPDKAQSLSLHSGRPKTDPFVEAVIEALQNHGESVAERPRDRSGPEQRGHYHSGPVEAVYQLGPGRKP